MNNEYLKFLPGNKIQWKIKEFENENSLNELNENAERVADLACIPLSANQILIIWMPSTWYTFLLLYQGFFRQELRLQQVQDYLHP